MWWRPGRDTSEARPLLPGPVRAAGAALLAACVALALAAFAAGRGNPGRLDTALDPRFQAWLGHFPVLLQQLPRLGGLPEVTLMVLALAVAAAMIAIGAHTFTDAVGGAAVGTGVVLACALTLDLAVRRVRRSAAEQSDPAYPAKAIR